MNPLALFVLAVSTLPLVANPQLTSWHTADSGQYARIYPTTAAETAGSVSKTWSRGTGVQNSPTYAGVSKIVYSNNWIYIRTSGLAGHIMGPWYLDAAKLNLFPNYPSNTAKVYRIPRNPTIPAAKSLTPLGASGCMVNGVSMFDMRDAFSYVSASVTDATPTNGLTGDGVWNRDGYHNEGVSFDPALAHQAGNNYHYHAQPIGLRYQLGDNVNYNPVTNRYSEKPGPVTKHSPILGWAADGLPVYGPYGYSGSMNPNSGVRRMISGYVLRNGDNGTTNLAITGRTTLPAWAQRIQTVAFRSGPTVSTNYALGHYLEDYDYLGDRGYTAGVQFDLNEYNVRWCVTPEFPSGTWAYFTTIKSDGTPAYPYTTGRQYFGSPTGGITTISETVTTFFDGGPNLKEKAVSPTVNDSNGDVTLVWSAAEGGTYQVQASTNLSTWSNLGSAVTATSSLAAITETGAANVHRTRFYRLTRTSLASFDSNGFDYSAGGNTNASATAPGGTVTRGTTVTLTINIPTNSTPPVPPANVAVSGVTIGGSSTGISSFVHTSQYVVTCTYAVPSSGITTGLKNVVVTFPGPGTTYTLNNAITIN